MVGRDCPVGVLLGSEVKPQGHLSGSISLLPTERCKEEMIYGYALKQCACDTQTGAQSYCTLHAQG